MTTTATYAPPAPATAELATCPVCPFTVYLAGETIHPCCAFARARGEDDCAGCRGFEKRRREGLA